MKARPGSGAPRWDDEGEYLISLSDFLGVLRRRLWVIALVAFVLAGIVTGYGLMQTPVYEASARIVVNQEPAEGEQQVSGSLSSDVQGLQGLTQTVAEAVSSSRVAEGAIQESGVQITPGTLLSNLDVQQVEETQFVDIRYRDPDPARASEVVNAAAAVSSDQISEISPSNAVTAAVWEPASEPEVPVSPDLLRNGILALLLGTILGLGLAFLLERLDNSWRSPEEAERICGAPTLAVVPKFKIPEAKAQKVIPEFRAVKAKLQKGER